jgi:PmbA protein
MSQDLLEKAKRVVQTARAKGADGARASISRNRNSRVEWRDSDLERIRESTTMSLNVSLYVGGRYTSHTTSDLRPDALQSFIENAVAMTRLLAPDPHRKLPDPARYAGRFQGDLGIDDPAGAASLDGAQRRRRAQGLVEAARSAPGADKIVSANSSWGDVEYESVMVTSNGMEAAERGTAFFCSSIVAVRDDGDRKPRDYWSTAGLFLNELESLDDVGRASTRRAIARLGARPIKTGNYPCVIENRVAGQRIGDLLSPLSGGPIQQQRSCMADKIGAEIGGSLLTITDEPHLKGGFGSTTFDSEGMATRRMPVFENGVLRNFYLDTYYASKLGQEPTTGSSTNLVFPAGTRDLADLLKVMGTGLLITDFRGGNSNDATGDFSTGVSGHWVENGELVHPVAEMNIAGNHLTYWKLLAELGNDPYLNSPIRVPSLRFNALQFSGV